ncbi:MAG: glycosyltransferase family 4 protein [Planctomycetaceae bacterium]|jgi:glycosyltransferase involved in cell wall biosynthesis|nr:glycosyltransferase family 4 protein [Planctomycetaceae bacterium]
MKVAHIITRLIIGGAQENTLFNCADLINGFGDDVLLLTGPTLGPEGSLMQRASEKIPIKIVPHLIRNISPFHDIRAYLELRQMLNEFQPDVVHTHSAKAGVLGRAAAWAMNPRPAVVHTVHGAPFYPYQNVLVRKFYQCCERWAAKRCDAIISVADAMTELMVNAGIAPREKFTTIYSGMDIEPFLKSKELRDTTRMKLGLTDDDIVIGKIARLFRLKGHEFVIDAASQIIRQVPNVRFLFVGDGILTAKHRAKIAKLGLEKYVLFAGLISPEEIPSLISAMDIVVHTSLREGLARVLPQALLSGKPVISYDIDGAKEAVLDGETGFLLPPKSVNELAAAAVKLAVNPELREQMGQNGRHKFSKRFDHLFMTEQIRQVYLQYRR